jgi:hypothetical protein
MENSQLKQLALLDLSILNFSIGRYTPGALAHFCVAITISTHRELVYRPLQFQKRSQYFFGTHYETLSVAMRVHNPDCSALGIDS